MNIGDLIQSLIYKEKENGRIINIITIDSTNYYEIYFPKTKETKTLEEKDIQKVTSPFEKLKKNQFDNSELFKLRIISEKLDSLLYQDKIITANNFKIMPLPHQVLAVNQILEQFKPRCLIADEVGLGKTIEAALIYEELKLRNIAKRILIIAPAGLTVQWKDELKTKFNEEFSIINRSTINALKEIHGDVNIWKKYDHVITSLDYLKPKTIKDSLSDKEKKRREHHNKFVMENCVNAQWDMVIFDEAHKLSKDEDGAETSRYKLGKALSETSPIFLMLTATPHQGNSEKFRHLLGLIDEYRFYATDSITADNVKSVTVKNRKRAATDFNGNLIFKSRIPSIIKITRDPNDVEVELYNEVTTYISEYYNLASRAGNFAFMFLLILYQRMVSSSSRAIFKSLKNRLQMLKNFQENLENLINNKEISDDLDSLDAENIYDLITNSEGNLVAIPDMINQEIEILEKCVSLAKKASSGRQDYKVRKTIDIINEVLKRENDEKTKFLIFTEFVATQYYLGEILENLGFKVAYLNGRMNLTQKIDAKIKFKEDHQILISTDAGGEGINLQFCHIIINYDLPWNPMKIEQRIGRLDRIGQKKDVLVFNFVIEDTVEERVRAILNEKLDLIAKQFGDDKKTDVLNLLQDEFSFDKIFIDAIKQKEKMIPELEKTGEMLFNKAKEILEKDDLLLPFSDKTNAKELKNLLVDSKSNLVKNLVFDYAKFKNVEINEYSKKQKVYHTDQPLVDEKLKNIVFDKDLALDNESFEFVNITHPLIKDITKEILKHESLTFNLDIQNISFNSRGLLFYYKIDLTNNENFLRRYLIPIFIDENNTYNEKISEWFEKEYNVNMKTGISSKLSINVDTAIIVAEEILNKKIKEKYSSTKLELVKQIEEEQKKFLKYFEDKEKAIKKIAIANIKLAKLEELNQQKIKEKINLEKKKNLVPKKILFTVAEINFR
jgi:SNF2 family DNA or RNA helicase